MGVPRHDLFPLGRYHLPHLKRHPFASVLTAFGCPHRCTFCAFERLPFRRRDPAEMEEELRRLAEMGVGELFLRDMTFGADRAHAERCLELLERRSFSWSCESRADTVDAAFLSRMKSAGCHTVMFGVESGSDEILRGCGKGLTTARLREAFALCRAAGIRTLAHFCLGLPGESEETFSKTMAFAAELDPDYATFNSAAPRLGTTLREQAVREGWMSDALEEYDPSRLLPLMSLPGLPRERAHAMRAEASRAFYLRPRWLLRRALGARTLHEALTLLREGAHLLRGL